MLYLFISLSFVCLFGLELDQTLLNNTRKISTKILIMTSIKHDEVVDSFLCVAKTPMHMNKSVHLKCHWIQWIPLNSMGPIFRQLEPLLTNLVRHFFQISFLSEWVLIPPKLILLDRWGQKIFLAGENNEGRWPMCLLYRLNSLIVIVMLSTYSVKAWTVYVVTYSL